MPGAVAKDVHHKAAVIEQNPLRADFPLAMRQAHALAIEPLLDACDFIIASRPGFRLDALRLVIPPEKLGRSSASETNKITLRKSQIHLLTTVASHVSSTEIRQRLEGKQTIHGLVPARVEEYILGQALYR